MAEDVELAVSGPAAQGDAHSDSLISLSPGAMVGKYRIVAVLGQGGFGITYCAIDTQLDREVAIKEYLPTSIAVRRPDLLVMPHSTQVAEDFRWGRDRFLEEAKTLARLTDAPGIVDVFDYLEANGTGYMVMALVHGETLEARLNRHHRLHQPAVELLLYPLLDGLEIVHEAGFLHRDIKPGNILLDNAGRPTLIDFGAARTALHGRSQTMTLVYTQGYAAPEQMTAAAKQGPWSDIYALAGTLYHCVNGHAPPSAIDRLNDDGLLPAAEVGKGRFGPSLLAGIDVGLKLKASDRPQTIADWRRALSGISVERRPGTSGKASNGTGNATRRMKGKLASQTGATRALPIAIVAGCVTLVAVAGGAWILLRPPAASQMELDAERAWNRAQSANTVAAYREYVGNNPSAQYVEEARRRISAIEEEKARADAEEKQRQEAARQQQALEQAEKLCSRDSIDEQTIKSCDAVIAAGRATAAAFSNRGEAYRRAGQFDRAIQDFDEAVRLDPKLVIAYITRGSAYSSKGQYDRAISDFDQAIGLDPGNAIAFNNRGFAYRNKGQQDRAIQDFDHAIRLSPDYAIAFRNRGVAYHNKRMYDHAIQDFDLAIGLSPDDAATYNNRGISLHEKRLYDRAIQDFDQAIRLSPSYALAYYNRADSYRLKGQYDRAIQDYDQAIRLNPNNPVAYHNRGFTYQNKGQLDRAIEDYDQAIRLNPSHVITFGVRGEAYQRKGQTDRAIQDFDQAIRLDPNYAIAYANRGLAYGSKGDYDRAIKDYDEAIRLDPGNATAVQNRAAAIAAKARSRK